LKYLTSFCKTSSWEIQKITLKNQILVYIETGRTANAGSITITTGTAPGGAVTSRTWKVRTN